MYHSSTTVHQFSNNDLGQKSFLFNNFGINRVYAIMHALTCMAILFK
jgi:hypothetical protein